MLECRQKGNRESKLNERFLSVVALMQHSDYVGSPTLSVFAPRASAGRKLTNARRNLVAIMVRLERSLRRDSDIVGLLLAELSQLHAELLKVQPRNLLIKVLGKHIDIVLILI